jgi:hypothetical protein
MNKENKIKFEPSTLETIDTAMLKYVESLDIHVRTNKGNNRVPVTWVGGERSYQVKEEFGIRDKNSILIFPQIAVKRTGFTKDLGKKGSFWSDIPAIDALKGGSISIGRRVQRKKTAEYANANSIRRKGKLNFQTRRKNNQVVYEVLTIPVPSYIEVNYEVVIRTDYQTHMNEILQKFVTDTNGTNYFLIEHNGHRYEAFYEPNISDESNVSNFDEEERKFRSVVPIRVLGYLITANKNEEKPYKSIRETAVDVALHERFDDGVDNPLKLYNFKSIPTYYPGNVSGSLGFWIGDTISEPSGSVMSSWNNDSSQVLSVDSGFAPFSTTSSAGFKAARFEGDQYMEYDSVAADLSDESLTIAVAFDQISKSETEFYFALGNTTDTANYIGLQGYNQTFGDPSTYSFRIIGRTSDNTLVISPGVLFNLTASYAIMTMNDKKINLWVNGSRYVTDLSYAGEFTFDNLRLGTLERSTGPFFELSGTILSYGVFNRELNNRERRELEQYWNDKYNYK